MMEISFHYRLSALDHISAFDGMNQLFDADAPSNRGAVHYAINGITFGVIVQRQHLIHDCRMLRTIRRERQVDPNIGIFHLSFEIFKYHDAAPFPDWKTSLLQLHGNARLFSIDQKGVHLFGVCSFF